MCLFVVFLRGQAQDHDRSVGWIDQAIGRVAGQVRRQIGARRVDRRLHIPRRAIDIAAQIELDRDAGLSELALRGHLRNAGDVAELPLQGGRDGGGHDLGACARQTAPTPRW